jgi:hypothetical protein
MKSPGYKSTIVPSLGLSILPFEGLLVPETQYRGRVKQEF